MSLDQYPNPEKVARKLPKLLLILGCAILLLASVIKEGRADYTSYYILFLNSLGVPTTASTTTPFPVSVTSGSGSSTTTPSYTKPSPYTNTVGDITGQSVTTAFSPSCPAGSTSIQIEPYGGAINVRTDGTTATAAAPVIEYQALTAVTLSPTPLSNISIIAVSGTGTTIGGECLK